MSNIIPFNPGSILTMTSLEISNLVASRHDSVKRTIERCAESGAITLPPLVEVSNTGFGPRVISVYRLDKRSSLIVVAQLSPEFTAAVVDRWQQLEAEASKPAFTLPDFTDPAVAAIAWAEQYREKTTAIAQAEQAQAKLAIVAPKAEALDRIAAGEENITMTQAAKVLGIKRELLTQWLHANGWVYRQNGSWVAYDAQIKTGRLAYKEAKYTDETTGQEVHRPYCHITPKGLAWLAEFGPQSRRRHDTGQRGGADCIQFSGV